MATDALEHEHDISERVVSYEGINDILEVSINNLATSAKDGNDDDILALLLALVKQETRKPYGFSSISDEPYDREYLWVHGRTRERLMYEFARPAELSSDRTEMYYPVARHSDFWNSIGMCNNNREGPKYSIKVDVIKLTDKRKPEDGEVVVSQAFRSCNDNFFISLGELAMTGSTVEYMLRINIPSDRFTEWMNIHTVMGRTVANQKFRGLMVAMTRPGMKRPLEETPARTLQKRIQAGNPGLQVHIVPAGSATTCEYRADRVRIYQDRSGNVGDVRCG